MGFRAVNLIQRYWTKSHQASQNLDSFLHHFSRDGTQSSVFLDRLKQCAADFSLCNRIVFLSDHAKIPVPLSTFFFWPASDCSWNNFSHWPVSWMIRCDEGKVPYHSVSYYCMRGTEKMSFQPEGHEFVHDHVFSGKALASMDNIFFETSTSVFLSPSLEHNDFFCRFSVLNFPLPYSCSAPFELIEISLSQIAHYNHEYERSLCRCADLVVFCITVANNKGELDDVSFCYQYLREFSYRSFVVIYVAPHISLTLETKMKIQKYCSDSLMMISHQILWWFDQEKRGGETFFSHFDHALLSFWEKRYKHVDRSALSLSLMKKIIGEYKKKIHLHGFRIQVEEKNRSILDGAFSEWKEEVSTKERLVYRHLRGWNRLFYQFLTDCDHCSSFIENSSFLPLCSLFQGQLVSFSPFRNSRCAFLSLVDGFLQEARHMLDQHIVFLNGFQRRWLSRDCVCFRELFVQYQVRIDRARFYVRHFLKKSFFSYCTYFLSSVSHLLQLCEELDRFLKECQKSIMQIKKRVISCFLRKREKMTEPLLCIKRESDEWRNKRSYRLYAVSSALRKKNRCRQRLFHLLQQTRSYQQYHQGMKQCLF